MPSTAPGAQCRPPDGPVPREQAQGGRFLQVQVQTWISCAQLLSEIKEVSGAANKLPGSGELESQVWLSDEKEVFVSFPEAIPTIHPILSYGNLEGHC